MPWTRQRWIMTTTFVLALQVAAIFALHTREPMLARLPAFGPTVQKDFPTNAPAPQPVELDDPLIFAGAHPQGFSGAAWLSQPRLRITFSNSVAPPTFLSFQRPASDFAASNAAPPLPTPLPFARLSIPPAPARKSLLFVEGDLASRPLRAKPGVPTQTAPEVLNSTVVQIAIQSNGLPLSSRILNGSGSRAADLAALQIANDIRFSSAKSNLQWGSLVFQWATEAPSTNPAATSAK